MKPGHKKTKSDYPRDFKSLQERVKQWKLPDGPFDYATRGKAVTKIHQCAAEIFQLCKRHPHDGELSELHSRAVQLWHLAIDAAYPAGFWRDFERLSTGDAAGLESAIAFLEADPMFFRTGYIKAKLIRYIKPGMITPADATRLQSAVLSVVDTRDDRDFRAFCRLARKVDAPKLRAALMQRLTHQDHNIRRRASWVLEALDADTVKKRNAT
jgi:hypothetical protein